MQAYNKSDSNKDKPIVKAINGVSLCCNFSALIFFVYFVCWILFYLLISYGSSYQHY